MKWNEDHTITVDPPKRPKKITGTRFAAIMGLNAWSTPFEAWCAITRTYEKPFEDTKYTIAGKVIEPKQAQYMVDNYFMANIVRPADVFGQDYFKATYGDFFKQSKIFGGMWDYLLRGGDGKYSTVLEMKTTKRVEDWTEDIPEYYAMQAALYAYLLGVDEVMMVCSFLEDSDYDNPEAYECTVQNTLIRPFKVSERYPDFEEIVQYAENWWNEHVVTGISPEYDETKDAEILKALRSSNPQTSDDLTALMDEAIALTEKIEKVTALVAEDEKRLTAVKDAIKAFAVDSFTPDVDTVSYNRGCYSFVTTRSVKDGGYDVKKMQKDGIDIEKYHKKSSETYRAVMKKE